jgi:hypothetical protein
MRIMTTEFRPPKGIGTSGTRWPISIIALRGHPMADDVVRSTVARCQPPTGYSVLHIHMILDHLGIKS